MRQEIVAETHDYRYFILSGSTKIYRDLWYVYCWNGMKKDIPDFVAKFPSYRKSRRTSETQRYDSRDRHSCLEVGCD